MPVDTAPVDTGATAASRARSRRDEVQHFERRLRHAVQRRAAGEPAALIHIAVNGAWDVRDACGSTAAGALRDAVAATLAGRMDAPVLCVPGGICAFCVLLENTRLDEAREQAHGVKRDVHALRFRWRGHPFRLDACAGVLELGAEPARARYWLAAAHEACAAARELAGSGVQVVALDGHAWSDIARRREWVQHLTEIIA
jgi:GGDEF domain-containing protein